jgi:hypothetical protein
MFQLYRGSCIASVNSVWRKQQHCTHLSTGDIQSVQKEGNSTTTQYPFPEEKKILSLDTFAL